MSQTAACRDGYPRRWNADALHVGRDHRGTGHLGLAQKPTVKADARRRSPTQWPAAPVDAKDRRTGVGPDDLDSAAVHTQYVAFQSSLHDFFGYLEAQLGQSPPRAVRKNPCTFVATSRPALVKVLALEDGDRKRDSQPAGEAQEVEGGEAACRPAANHSHTVARRECPHCARASYGPSQRVRRRYFNERI